MPVDELGIRADILISPDSVFNRMNPGQEYEQWINRGGQVIRLRYQNGELGSESEAFDYVMSWIHDVRPIYAEYLMANVLTDEDRITQFMLGVRDKGIYINIPPFCGEIGPEKILALEEKFHIGETPVTYTHYKSDGTAVKVTTKSPVCIGEKYLYLLGKIPLSMMSAIQVGYVNQFNTPAKPRKTLSKGQIIYGQTPIRYGEDELCMMTMSLGPESVARFVGTNANSPVAIKAIADGLLTAKNPTQMQNINMSTEEVIRTNVNVGIFAHQMGAIGYDVGEKNIARSKETLK